MVSNLVFVFYFGFVLVRLSGALAADKFVTCTVYLSIF